MHQKRGRRFRIRPVSELLSSSRRFVPRASFSVTRPPALGPIEKVVRTPRAGSVKTSAPSGGRWAPRCNAMHCQGALGLGQRRGDVGNRPWLDEHPRPHSKTPRRRTGSKRPNIVSKPCSKISDNGVQPATGIRRGSPRIVQDIAQTTTAFHPRPRALDQRIMMVLSIECHGQVWDRKRQTYVGS